MVNDRDLTRIEQALDGLLALMSAYEEKFNNLPVTERFKIRAKSHVYQSLFSLIIDCYRLKQFTMIVPDSLAEFKRKTEALLRLIDDGSDLMSFNAKLIERIEMSIKFESI